MSTFQMQEQKLDQWCWAAVGVSVAKYFEPDSTLDQFQLAALVLNMPGGCRGNAIPECDKGASLTTVFEKLNRLAGNSILGPVSFAQVRQVIDGGWPIPVRIVWDDNPGNAHAVVITGYSISASGVPLLQVDDPFYDRSILSYDTFVSSYHGSGRWERTYRLA